MINRTVVSLASIVCVFSLSTAFAKTSPSLCAPEEKVVFTCQTTKAKVVSLCGVGATKSEAGYLQYRIGAVGKLPEMVHPALKLPSKEGFQYGTLMYAAGGGTFVQFAKGNYKYVTYSASGKGWDKSGVSVTQAGKPIAEVLCKKDEGDLDRDFVEKQGVPRTNDDFEVP